MQLVQDAVGNPSFQGILGSLTMYEHEQAQTAGEPQRWLPRGSNSARDTILPTLWRPTKTIIEDWYRRAFQYQIALLVRQEAPTLSTERPSTDEFCGASAEVISKTLT